ncbi:hypothetical protein EBX93_17300 [bacterium]|nr:hypothetical protein [bacterium]
MAFVTLASSPGSLTVKIPGPELAEGRAFVTPVKTGVQSLKESISGFPAFAGNDGAGAGMTEGGSGPLSPAPPLCHPRENGGPVFLFRVIPWLKWLFLTASISGFPAFAGMTERAARLGHPPVPLVTLAKAGVQS